MLSVPEGTITVRGSDLCHMLSVPEGTITVRGSDFYSIVVTLARPPDLNGIYIIDPNRASMSIYEYAAVTVSSL